MYSDIPTYPIALNRGSSSVLVSFPKEDSQVVVSKLVKSFASQLGLQIASKDLVNTTKTNGSPITLQNETQIIWFMEVVCHGLCSKLEDHEILKDCVNIYCEWLSALLPNPKVTIIKKN